MAQRSSTGNNGTRSCMGRHERHEAKFTWTEQKQTNGMARSRAVQQDCREKCIGQVFSAYCMCRLHLQMQSSMDNTLAREETCWGWTTTRAVCLQHLPALPFLNFELHSLQLNIEMNLLHYQSAAVPWMLPTTQCTSQEECVHVYFRQFWCQWQCWRCYIMSCLFCCKRHKP